MNPALETKECLALLKATVVVAGDDIVFEKHSVVEALIVILAAAAGYAQGIIFVEQAEDVGSAVVTLAQHFVKHLLIHFADVVQQFACAEDNN